MVYGDNTYNAGVAYGAGGAPTGSGSDLYKVSGQPGSFDPNKVMMYTGNLVKATPGYGAVDTSFLHTGRPSAQTNPPGHYEERVNPAGSWLSGLDLFGSSHTNVYVPGQRGTVSIGVGVANPVVRAAQGAAAAHYEQVSIAQFVTGFANSDGAAIMALQAKLVAAGAMPASGYVKGLYDDATRRGVYQVALAVSARHDPMFTFDTALNQAIKYNAQQNANNTTTATTFDISSPDQAKGYALSALQNLLGRDPTPTEYAAFAGQLNAYERAHPQVTTTTSTNAVDPVTGGAAVKSRTSTGGVTEAQRNMQAIGLAEKAPDYHAVQGVKFLGALEELAHAANQAGTSTSGV